MAPINEQTAALKNNPSAEYEPAPVAQSNHDAPSRRKPRNSPAKNASPTAATTINPLSAKMFTNADTAIMAKEIRKMIR